MPSRLLAAIESPPASVEAAPTGHVDSPVLYCSGSPRKGLRARSRADVGMEKVLIPIRDIISSKAANISFLARSRSAGIAALFQAESDTAAYDSNSFESRGRVSDLVSQGETNPCLREKIRRDDAEIFRVGIIQKMR